MKMKIAVFIFAVAVGYGLAAWLVPRNAGPPLVATPAPSPRVDIPRHPAAPPAKTSPSIPQPARQFPSAFLLP